MAALGTVGNVPPASVLCEANLDGAAKFLDALGEVDLHEVPLESVYRVLDGVELIRRQVEALGARALATIDADGRWAVDGARSMAAWYRNRAGRHHAAAAQQVRQARALRDHLPGTAAALAAGQISTDHAAAMARHTTDTPARRDQLADPEVGEPFLVTQATAMDASAFTLLLRHWALRADPDAGDRAYRAESDREEFHLAETTDGYVPSGWLSKTSGALLLEALDARTGTPAADDSRSPGQRRAGALTGIARLTLDSGVLRPGARIRPHITVTVPFDTLHRLTTACRPTHHHPGCPRSGDADHPGAAFGLPPGAPSRIEPPAAFGHPVPMDLDDGLLGCTCGGATPVITADLDAEQLTGEHPATLSDGTPLSPTQLARLTCGGGLHRVVFGPGSEVLDVGREERLFTPAQTRAIIARDRHCRFPGCNAPPGEGEIHHSIWWWAQSGRTDTRLGILLCWHHHDFVHTRHITIERHPDRWTFLRRDGTILGHTLLPTAA